MESIDLYQNLFHISFPTKIIEVTNRNKLPTLKNSEIYRPKNILDISSAKHEIKSTYKKLKITFDATVKQLKQEYYLKKFND